VSSVPIDLISDLLTQSFVAWRIVATVERDRDGVVVSSAGKVIRIERAPDQSIFRWMVTIDGRNRAALSVVAMLRQVREALDPDYTAYKVRVIVAPMGAS